MPRFKRNADLSALVHSTEEVSEVADSSCTTGYDNDGSTGLEIFENGFDLGQKAGDKDVWIVLSDGVADFFIGTLAEVIKRIKDWKNQE